MNFKKEKNDLDHHLELAKYDFKDKKIIEALNKYEAGYYSIKK